ncbi:MAG: hypothetical protein J6Y29_00235, partial [Clostridiales bacterium]|nr:hypothetical protein [Clostridiales bacterium]
METNMKNNEGRSFWGRIVATLKKKRNKRILGGVVIFVGLILLFNMINDDVSPEGVSEGGRKRGEGVRIGIVLSQGGKGDKSFNDG